MTTTRPARPFKLFLSYSHRNEATKDRLKINLAPLVRTGWAELWDDREIPAGADWREEIDSAMTTADAAVFLLDDDFVASDFCMDVEVAAFLEQHRNDGTLIVFVVTDYCGWKRFDFIERFKVIPLDGRPITSYRPYSKAYTHIQEEIGKALAGHRPKSVGADFAHLPTLPTTRGEAPLGLPALLAKLPGRSSYLFGRAEEQALLDAWRSHKGVFLWVADGGMGKSTLVRWWLEQQADWPAGTRFLGHSFYRQGTRSDAASARAFLVEALQQLGIAHADNAPDAELGRLLAAALAAAPTVLVLDGIEPLQQAAGDPLQNGRLTDDGLAALLEALARQPGQALCLASSRRPLADATIVDAGFFRARTLHTLPPPDALALLRQRGILGSDDELGAMAERCGHHALALVLAAEFCHTFLAGRAADFLARPWPPNTGEAHAVTVMAWFDATLAAEHQALDRELARILGLFDRPAPWGALLALQAAPPIAGLSEHLHRADETAVFESLARLAQWGLLQADLAQPAPELDAHPLVREHFGRQLEAASPDAWRSAHGVLFEWFRRQPEKERPDTLEELEPLYRAVRHGCRAGLYQQACDEVYYERILRGTRNDGFYSIKHLGAFGADLVAVACFFVAPWRQPAPALKEGHQAWLLNEAAFRLRALGRLEEALEPMRAGAQMGVQQENWESAARSYSNLSELQLSLGRVAAAVADAELGVQYADRSGDAVQRMINRATLADALHQQGAAAAARDRYVEAEAMQAQHQPEYPLLYSLPGFHYCDLLLAAAERAAWRGAPQPEALGPCDAVAQRANGAQRAWREIFHNKPSILTIALDHLSLARCALYRARLQGQAPGADAQDEIERAVAGLRSAGRQDHLPRGLLTRAWLRHCLDDATGAQADLAAAHQIAARGAMRLHRADIALTRARLFHDRKALAEARQLIEACGYGRRLPELEDAEAAAASWPA